MTTSYPGGIDAFARPAATDKLGSPSHSELHDNAFDAIEAIEGELGLNPSGTDATVADRLASIEARLAALEGP